MSDTRKETVTPEPDEDIILVGRGEHWEAVDGRRINWCKTHDSQEFAPEEGTKVICLQAVFRYEMDEDDGSPCELVELWQEQP